jgi:hypothetical protein
VRGGAVDRLFSLFSLYDFVTYIFTGAALIAGVVWAVAGVPAEPGATALLGLAVASYIAGHLAQALGVLWEAKWWKAKGGWPSDVRMTPGKKGCYQPELRDLIVRGLEMGRGGEIEKLEPKHLFALARAELRTRNDDVRAELLNALYAFSRGLATVSFVLTVTFVVVWLVTGEERLVPAAIVAAVASALFLYRFNRFGFYFADQVWRDYATTIRSCERAATSEQ